MQGGLDILGQWCIRVWVLKRIICHAICIMQVSTLENINFMIHIVETLSMYPIDSAMVISWQVDSLVQLLCSAEKVLIYHFQFIYIHIIQK